ncbi:MAG TPA: DUF5686 family protein [Sphingobacteriaceae bacterium]
MGWLFTLLFCACLAVDGFGQHRTVSGRVTDPAGNAVPFARIRVQPDDKNYLANESGFFSFTADSGRISIRFLKMGFAPAEDTVEVTDNVFTSVILEPARMRSPKETITGEELVRKVIEARAVDEQERFAVQVYMKGVQKLLGAPRKFLSRQVAGVLKVDSARRTILYQSESVSRIYDQGRQKKEVLISRKTAGSHEGLTFDRASDLDVDFFAPYISWKAFGQQAFVSPLGEKALRHYRYKLLGCLDMEGNRVYRLAVIPKHAADPLFTGDLYILEHGWQLVFADLRLGESSRINFVDSVRISQSFTEIRPHLWKPEHVTIQTRGTVLGFDFAGYFAAVYSGYTQSPEPDDSGFLANEVLREAGDAREKDPLYWAAHRPIVLTSEEQMQYQIRDSLESEARSRHLKDLKTGEPNRFKPVRYFVAGYKWNDDLTRKSWYISSLKNTGFYNAVEGWGFRFQAGYSKQFNLRQELEVTHNFRYGFGNDKLNSNVQITFRYDTIRHASFVLRVGTDFLDLNNRGTLNLFYNSITSLFGGRNYMQLYRSKFVSLYTQRELADGLIISAGAEIARRMPTLNRLYAPLIQSAEKAFSMPVNDIDGIDRSLFPVNNALTFETTASYTFAQKYAMRPDGKYYEDPRLPTIKLRYRKGIRQVLNSAVNYDFLSADLYQEKIRTGGNGFSSFYISAGKFLNAQSLFFPDIHHFTGNQTAYSNPIFPNFHFLNHYAYSTREKYLEAHYEHNFSGLLTRRIPLLRKLKLEEIVGGAYLGQPNATYKELYFGFQRLMIRADYGFFWPTNQKMMHAFRFFYGF